MLHCLYVVLVFGDCCFCCCVCLLCLLFVCFWFELYCEVLDAIVLYCIVLVCV